MSHFNPNPDPVSNSGGVPILDSGTGHIPPEDQSAGLTDAVCSPKHYRANGMEVIDVIEAFVPQNPHLANVVKYVLRAGRKDPDKYEEDLKKAAWYLDRAIQVAKRSTHNPNP